MQSWVEVRPVLAYAHIFLHTLFIYVKYIYISMYVHFGKSLC